MSFCEALLWVRSRTNLSTTSPDSATKLQQLKRRIQQLQWLDTQQLQLRQGSQHSIGSLGVGVELATGLDEKSIWSPFQWGSSYPWDSFQWVYAHLFDSHKTSYNHPR